MAQGAFDLNLHSDGNLNKRLREHWYSEEVEGYLSCRRPLCAGVERAPEKRCRGTQGQIDVGRLGGDLHATLQVRRNRLPAVAFCHVAWHAPQASVVLVLDPSSSHRGRCCQTEASVATAVKTRLTKPPSPGQARGQDVDSQEGRHHEVSERRRWQLQTRYSYGHLERQSFFQVVSSGTFLMVRLHFGRWTTPATAPIV